MQPINSIPGLKEPAFIGTMPCQIVFAEIGGTVKIQYTQVLDLLRKGFFLS
jgi:hypothetical protein